MTYKETLDFLYHNLPMYQRTGKAAYKANLDNTLKLDEALNHPHRSFKSIHVAGTNGKGSVSHMLTSVLQQNGYKTGLYTSPHMLDFRERIRVNGIPIGKKDVVDFVTVIMPLINTIKPSFFEITVAMAFEYFRKEEVDIAVIETGLGGRLDSTNIITPELTLITNISMDHMEFLGHSLEEIAAEKAGIIKQDVPVVFGTENPSVLPVLKSFAKKKNSRIFISSQTRKFKYRTETLQKLSNLRYLNTETLLGESWEIDLLGDYQKENLATTLQAIDVLNVRGWKLSPGKIRAGLSAVYKNTGIRGRWETIGANPKIICDVAHNEDGIREVIAQLISIPAKNLHIIWGMVNDKSTEDILPLLPKNAIYYFTKASIPRALDANKLGEQAHAMDLSGDSYPTVKAAIETARDKAETEDVIFIGGSTFVVADALEAMS